MAESRSLRRQAAGRGALAPLAMALVGFLMIWAFVYFSTVDLMTPIAAVTLGGAGLALLIAAAAWWLWRIANARLTPRNDPPRGGF